MDFIQQVHAQPYSDLPMAYALRKVTVIRARCSA